MSSQISLGLTSSTWPAIESQESQGSLGLTQNAQLASAGGLGLLAQQQTRQTDGGTVEMDGMGPPHPLAEHAGRRRHLETLWAQGAQFLGTRYSLLGGAMTWVSDRHLVAAISEAGGFGVLAGGSMTADALAAEIAGTRDLTAKPFGVNLIVFHPHFEQLLDVCIAQKVGHVFLGGGMPTRQTIDRLKAAGIKVVGFAPSGILARRLQSWGVDALVAEGAEAGGHIGPMTTSVLAQEVLAVANVPVFVAGGIGHGRAIAAYLTMGAAGCQLGTRFVCAKESQAHSDFKQAFIRAQGRDAVVSAQVDPSFPVIPVRALENQGTRAFMDLQRDVIASYHRGELSHKEAHLKIELFWAGALRRAVVDGDVQTGSLMAGQSVGMVCAIEPCAQIVQDLVNQAQEALDLIL
jgi:enoyl-[acyl-carrier protein] reductase II